MRALKKKRKEVITIAVVSMRILSILVSVIQLHMLTEQRVTGLEKATLFLKHVKGPLKEKGKRIIIQKGVM